MSRPDAKADPRQVKAIENTDKITEMLSDFIREKYGDDPDSLDLKLFASSAMAALNFIFFSVLGRNGNEALAVDWQEKTIAMTFSALRDLGGINFNYAIAYKEPEKENKDGP
jgi:hypothetical protein